MKSGISSIFAYLVFCTHLVQIRVLDFLLESSAYQPFSLILQFELHGFRLKTDHPDWTVVEHGVYTKNAQGQIRIYDGAVLTDKGLYFGIETKSGKACKTKSQKSFDAMVSETNPVNVYGKSKTKDGITKIYGVLN